MGSFVISWGRLKEDGSAAPGGASQKGGEEFMRGNKKTFAQTLNNTFDVS